MFKKISVILILCIVTSFLVDIFYPQYHLFSFFKQKQSIDELESATEISELDTEKKPIQNSVILITKVDKTNAWELLKSSDHQISFQEYDFGIFIEEIDGLKGDENNFWAIYLNNEKSLVGIKDIVLNVGDVIEFKYEAIEK